jgi:alpha-L-arabinofuranosidase
MAKLNVVTRNRRFAVEPSLYGLFFEDINRAGDGGLYPELLRNRTFEDSLHPEDLTEERGNLRNGGGWELSWQKGEGLPGWRQQVEPTDIPAWYGEDAQLALLTEDTLNERRKAALRVDFRPGGVAYNVGFGGVPVREGEVYRLLFFARVQERKELEVSLRSGDGAVARGRIRLQGKGFVRYELSLTAQKTDKQARFCLSVREGGRVDFGYVSLMPADTYCGHGLRKDLCRKLEELHPAFLRFPGGCIVEGFSRSTVMRFKNMVGPAWERPTLLNLWSYNSTQGLGFHEYLQLCEDLGTDALYVCNCGMTCQVRSCVLMEDDEIEELLDDVFCALEYALGGADTVWGALRASMGHPEPFGLRYLEIGNENNGPEYETRYERFRSAVLEKYPELTIIANTHVEESGLKLDIADEHFYDKAEWFAENTHYYDGYDRKGPGIFVGEFAVVAGEIRTLYTAVAEAMFMVGMERNQDIVKLAAYAPLFEHVGYAAWEPNLIAFDGLDSYGIPSYYVWKLFGCSRGDYVLESSQECGCIYAPYLKGGPCLAGSEGVRFRGARWKGREVQAQHFLFGGVQDCGEQTFMTVASEDSEEAERAKRFGMEGTVLIAMGDDLTSREGSFEIELLAEPGKELGIGMFATPYGKARNSEDSPWNLFAVQPIRWTVGDGVSRLQAGVGFRRYSLAQPVEVSLEMGRYHRFCMESDGRRLSCRIDGETVTEIELPHYDELQTIALEEGEEILLKVVNLAEEERPVEISLDCPVETAYEAGVIAGNPSDRNSLTDPETVTDRWSVRSGAASEFVYPAPACSVSVLRLKKGEVRHE